MKIIKRKGFTLVELLGVIILLGVIVLLITPNILKVQKKSEKDLFEASVNSLLRSAQLYYANNNFINYPTSGIAANLPDLDAKNNINFNIGMIKLVNKEYFYADNVTNGNYCAVGVRNDLTITEGACPETPDRCFDFDEQTGTITKFRRDKVGCDITNPTVPEKINGVTVKKIGTAAFAKYDYFHCYDGINKKWLDITDINDVINNNNYIYKLYFDYQNCSAKLDNDKSQYNNLLISIKLPQTIEVIDNHAFANSNIIYVNFEDLVNLKSINSGAFLNNKIKNVNLSNSKKLEQIKYEAFRSNEINSLNINELQNLKYIGVYAFSNNSIESSINFINMPIEHIDSYAFAVNKIKNIKFENLPNLKIIDSYAFLNNEYEELTLKDLNNLESIGKQAFSFAKIKKLVIKNLVNLKLLGNMCFMDYNNIPYVDIDNLPMIEKIPMYFLSSDGSAVYTNQYFNISNIPNLKIIDNYAFWQNFITGDLHLDNFPNLETLNTGAFGHSRFNNIIFNNPKLKVIGYNAFISNYNISTANFENCPELTTIGITSFWNNSLDKLTISAKVTSIGGNAFGLGKKTFKDR